MSNSLPSLYSRSSFSIAIWNILLCLRMVRSKLVTMHLIPQDNELINDVSYIFDCSFRNDGEQKKHFHNISQPLKYHNRQLLQIIRMNLVVTSRIWRARLNRWNMKDFSPWNGANLLRITCGVSLYVTEPWAGSDDSPDDCDFSVLVEDVFWDGKGNLQFRCVCPRGFYIFHTFILFYFTILCNF